LYLYFKRDFDQTIENQSWKKLIKLYLKTIKIYKEHLYTHNQLAGGWCGLGDSLDGLGRLDLSNDNDVHGYLFCAHFWFWLVFVERNIE